MMSVDRCGSVTVTLALMLTTLDIVMKDCMKPVMKGKTVQRINFSQGLYNVAQCQNVVVGRGREHGVLWRRKAW